jgi:hypothetical protein
MKPVADPVNPPINFKIPLQDPNTWTTLLTPTVPTLLQGGVNDLPNSIGGMKMLTAFQVETENMLRQYDFPHKFYY